MTTWSYRPLADLALAVRARHAPRLLATLLGPEAPPAGEPSLVLDLTPETAVAPLALDGEGVVSVRGSYKGVPWSCRLTPRGEGSWEIAFRSAVFRDYLAFHTALLPVLRRLLLARGVALVSGAAFELDGETTLVAGPPGSGKTKTLLAALARGGRLIGDEYLGLREDGELVPLVRAIALRRGSLAESKLGGRLPRRDHVALRVQALLSTITRGRLQPLLHIAPAGLGITVAEPGRRVGRFLWLEPDSSTTNTIDALPIAEAVRRLLLMQRAHDVWYGDVGALLPASDYAARWSEIVSPALDGAFRARVSCATGRSLPRDLLDGLVVAL